MTTLNKISDNEYELCNSDEGYLYYSEKDAIEDQSRKHNIESSFVTLRTGHTLMLLKGFFLVESGIASVEGELASGYKIPTINIRPGAFHKVDSSDIIHNLEEEDLVVLHIWYNEDV